METVMILNEVFCEAKRCKKCNLRHLTGSPYERVEASRQIERLLGYGTPVDEIIDCLRTVWTVRAQLGVLEKNLS